MSAPTAEATIRYLGPGDGAELWGGTQADFVIDWPHRARPRRSRFSSRTQPPARWRRPRGGLDTADSRVEAARVVGEAWLSAQVARERHLDSLVVISAATLRERPELVDAVRSGGS